MKFLYSIMTHECVTRNKFQDDIEKEKYLKNLTVANENWATFS